MNSRIIYYIIRKELRKVSEKEKQEYYDKAFKDALDYHNRYGKNGFLSERTCLKNIPLKAKSNTEHYIYTTENVPLHLHSVAVTDETIESIKKGIEKCEGFEKWI